MPHFRVMVQALARNFRRLRAMGRPPNKEMQRARYG